MKTLINEKDYRNGRIDIEIKINELKGNFNEMSIEINKKKKLQQLEQVANLSTYPSRHFNSFCYDDDDDEEYTIAITPEKPVNSLIMEDEHLDTILEIESDELIKFSVENLVPTPSESEDLSDIESEFNPLIMKTSDSARSVRFDAESYLLESLVNHDTLMASPPKIDFLLDEFVGELTRLQSIPPGIDNINLDPEGDILFLESLLYDNSSPRPPKAFQDNSNTIIESLPTFPIPVKDSDSLREEIDIFFSVRMISYPWVYSTINVVEDIPVDVPNILPTHPALHMDSTSFLSILI
ncbi:hypothetical protein Tco_0419323 [Tanacetum coccineum]